MFHPARGASCGPASTSSTERPARASSPATAEPPAPLPTTTASPRRLPPPIVRLGLATLARRAVAEQLDEDLPVGPLAGVLQPVRALVHETRAVFGCADHVVLDVPV